MCKLLLLFALLNYTPNSLAMQPTSKAGHANETEIAQATVEINRILQEIDHLRAAWIAQESEHSQKELDLEDRHAAITTSLKQIRKKCTALDNELSSCLLDMQDTAFLANFFTNFQQ